MIRVLFLFIYAKMAINIAVIPAFINVGICTEEFGSIEIFTGFLLIYTIYRMVSAPYFRKTRRHKRQSWPKPGPYQCHPSTSFSKETGCLPAEYISKAIKDLKITPLKQTPLEALAHHLGVDANNQRTLLNALPLTQSRKDSLAKSYLRPAYPEAWKTNPKEWLDSNDIRNVMRQYEEARSDFIFLGPFPIDFASPDPYGDKQKCLIEEMCDLNLDREEIRGKKFIGIVFNLDRHDRDGSHWVAAFIDIVKDKCYYFDSYGMRPPNQIYRFMQWLTIQEPKMELARNGARFQLSKSECGMFSMYFILSMLNGMDFKRFCMGRPPDSLMFTLRTWFYST
jgi:hypothetical protein